MPDHVRKVLLGLCAGAVLASLAASQRWATSREADAAREGLLSQIQSLEGDIEAARRRLGRAIEAANAHQLRRPDTRGKQEQARQWNTEIAQLQSELAQALKEIGQGLVCTACKRTQTELIRDGINWVEHARENSQGGVLQPLSPAAVASLRENKTKEFAAKIANLEQQVQQIEAQMASAWRAFQQREQELAVEVRTIEYAISEVQRRVSMLRAELGFATMQSKALRAQEEQAAAAQARAEAARAAEALRQAEERERETLRRVAEERERERLEMEREARLQAVEARRREAEAERLAMEEREALAARNEVEARERRDAERQARAQAAAQRDEEARTLRAARERAAEERWLREQMRRAAARETEAFGNAEPPPPGIPPEAIAAEQRMAEAAQARRAAEQKLRDEVVRQESQNLGERVDAARVRADEAVERLRSALASTQQESRSDVSDGAPPPATSSAWSSLRGAIAEGGDAIEPQGPNSVLGDRLADLGRRVAVATRDAVMDHVSEEVRAEVERMLEIDNADEPLTPAGWFAGASHTFAEDLLESSPTASDGILGSISRQVLGDVVDRAVKRVEYEALREVAGRVYGISWGGTGDPDMDRLDEEWAVNVNPATLMYRTGGFSIRGLRDWMSGNVDRLERTLAVAVRGLGLARDDDD